MKKLQGGNQHFDFTIETANESESEYALENALSSGKKPTRRRHSTF